MSRRQREQGRIERAALALPGLNAEVSRAKLMNDYPVAVPASAPSGISAVATAFRRALASQLQPRMLLAMFLPFLIAFVGAIVLIWMFWTPLTDWLETQALDFGLINTMEQWMVAVGLFSLKLYLAPLLAAFILLPLSGILGLIVAAVFVMPIVLNHVGRRDYADVERQGKFLSAVGVWNAIWVGTVFCIGWVLTLPLWLIPPLPIVLSVWWWTYAFTRIMRFDAVVEHASAHERRILWKRHNRQLWLIGLCLALMNLFPPAWLVLPVYSALVFVHFSLEALRQLRRHAAAGVDTLILEHKT